MLISQPERVGGALRCAISFTCAVWMPPALDAINDGEDLSRTSVKGLLNQPSHSGEGYSIHRKDLVLILHACASRLGERLDQITRAVGVLKRRPRSIGIEEAVEDRSRPGYIKERRTRNQYGQQHVR